MAKRRLRSEEELADEYSRVLGLHLPLAEQRARFRRLFEGAPVIVLPASRRARAKQLAKARTAYGLDLSDEEYAAKVRSRRPAPQAGEVT